ncbi:MAG: hypothetical protein FP826_08775 [Sphingomonadales bacterium]|nr:hypothetical protein [Sphingomonadales bacterium]MBU3992586.1 hypothetical protein [Alphaproteobacteria bacterium]
MTRPAWNVQKDDLDGIEGGIGWIRRKRRGVEVYDYYGVIGTFWVWLAPFGNCLPEKPSEHA